MITIKSEREMQLMRQAGKVIGRLLKLIESKVCPDVSTEELDRFAEEFIRSEGAKPAFKGYQGFPATLCTSVNDEVVHGIPGKRRLKEGDIIGIDVGAVVDGFYADAARTFAVGKISEECEKLIQVARSALSKGIERAVAGNRISDISHAIEMVINPLGFGIVRQYVGHGIGSNLHEEPQVPNFGKPNQGPEIKAGMALAIEPMVNAGKDAVVLMSDGWTVKTQDGRPSSHFENTILINEKGNEIITANV
jgi:methionyl aminopeptidase